MTLSEIQELVSACKYKPGWEIFLGYEEEGDRPYIQIKVSTLAEASVDSITGLKAAWSGGKRYLSYHMCRQEVVGAVFGAIKDAEMHETHEWFRYKGASIYNPHLDPDALAGVARRKNSFNVRKNAMSMEET